MSATAIIAIGTELTLGQTVDTNSAWLAAQLAAAGAPATLQLTVPDDLDAIVAALRAAARHARTVVLTGGLGPTADDLTRAALARASGGPLRESAEALAAIERIFAERGLRMSPANRVQALVPEGASVLANPVGTAPGLRVQVGAATCYSLPGVPREMKRMFSEHVAPGLGAVGAVIRARVLHCCGRGESDIGAAIADLMAPGRSPGVGTTAKDGIVGVRINARAATPAAAAALLDTTEREVRARLGTLVFGRDTETLAQSVGALLLARGATLATAESCTGGWLGKLLTDTPGSSRYYAGGVVAYANLAKTELLGVAPQVLASHGAVSARVAEEMADGARERFRCDYALSTTGIAGPGGGTPEKPVGLVYVALASAAGSRATVLRLGERSDRDLIRRRTVVSALNLLRMSLHEAT